jgi:hypothetical protein
MKGSGENFLQVFGFLWIVAIINILIFEKLKRMGAEVTDSRARTIYFEYFKFYAKKEIIFPTAYRKYANGRRGSTLEEERIKSSTIQRTTTLRVSLAIIMPRTKQKKVFGTEEEEEGELNNRCVSNSARDSRPEHDCRRTTRQPYL